MPDGQIVTFYSYKGGTGRTMALANVAWILAANGCRVLVADWDLESPGLHRFFQPFMPTDVDDESGIIDMVRAYEWTAHKNGEGGAADLTSAQVQHHAFSLTWEFPDGGGLNFLSAGRQNTEYAATLAGLDWENFYDRLGGGTFFNALRADMKRHYDYVLIDSRTGLSDVASICTIHLPDVLVDCFTLSTQGIEGAAHVARNIQQTYGIRDIRILPVPMRVDLAEKERAEMGHAFARRRFPGLPAGLSEEQRRAYWAAVEVPYQPFYAYEEILAVFGDVPGSPNTLLASYERLTAQITQDEITSLPEMAESLREETKERFARPAPSDALRVIVEHAPEDQVWAEWIRTVLTNAGIRILERDSATAQGEPEKPAPRVLKVISSEHSGRVAGGPSLDLPYLAAYVADTRPFPQFSGAAGQAFLAGASEQEAVKRLLGLLGVDVRPVMEGARFPGTDPRIFKAPARNARFTGREEDLGLLRTHLREAGTAVVLPVALQGLGGVGKTQVALEYVHRFKTDYDLVWWVESGQPTFVDASLADLAARLGEVYDVPAPAGANVSEMARLVLQTLGNRHPVDRWLLVFDNAEDIEELEEFIPAGRGHKLITSRNRAWSERATPLQVDVFARQESISYLRQRTVLSEDEARQVADALGDLPLAVATAGAWLAETGVSVQDYLEELRRRGPHTLSISQLDNYPAPVARAWDLSLKRLKERSPAASKLFELCSLLAPGIKLDLLYTPAMASVLEPYDPALAEPLVIGRVTQEINRLALIKLDTSARQIHIHRLVQAVVRDRMSPEELPAAQHDIHRVLAAARPTAEVDDPRSWDRYRMIWPHLIPSGAMSSPIEEVRGLFIDRVRYLWQRGDLDRGRDLALRTLEAWREMLAADPDPHTAERLPGQILRLQFNLSNILRDLARFEECRALDEEVLAGQNALLGPEHPHTLTTAGSFTASLRALGRYRLALDKDLKTHADWSRLYGDEYPRTLAAANNLAASYRANGDFLASLRLDEQTYDRRRDTLGPDHPLTLHSASAVARDLLEAGRYNDAASRMKSVRDNCRRALGVEHRTTLNAEVLLGVALRGAGRAEDARKPFKVALDGLSRRFGPDSSDALSAKLSNSANLLALGQLDAGRAEIIEVRTVYQERLGGTHPHTLVCEVNLASALRLNERTADALAVIRQANDELEKSLGEDHPYTLAGLMVMAVLLSDEGDNGQAEEVEALSVRRMRTVLGPQHPDTLRCQANLLLTRWELGDEGAAPEREGVITDLAGLLGENHPHIGTLRAGRRLVRGLDPLPF